MMPPLRDRLRREAQRLGVPEDLVERDYALGHALAALFGPSGLAECLVFKGGTALKKAYFGDYRFSVDLDFSAVQGPRGADLESAVRRVARLTAESLSEYGPLDVQAARRRDRGAHPGGQEAFRLLVQFPWRGAVPCSIKLEITVDEAVLLPVVDRPLSHGYAEPLAATLRCYSLEEIVAEKLRTLLQARRRLEAGRWTRNCARDYYDLWRLATSTEPVVDYAAAAAVLPAKAAVRDVGFATVDDFFVAVIVDETRRQWEGSLVDLVGELPPFDDVVDELRERLSEVV